MQSAALAAVLTVFCTGSRATPISAYARIDPSEVILFPAGPDGQEHIGTYRPKPVPLLSTLDDLLRKLAPAVHWRSIPPFPEGLIPVAGLTPARITFVASDGYPLVSALPFEEDALPVPEPPSVLSVVSGAAMAGVLVWRKTLSMKRRRRRRRLELRLREMA